MTFEYEFTYDEYVETLRASARVNRDWSRLPRIVGLAGFAVAFLLLAARPAAPALLMGMSLFIALYPMHWSQGQLKDRWANDPHVRQPLCVTLAEDEISWSTPTSRAHLKWSAIERVSETRRLILLHRSSHDFISIPKRALSSPDTLGEFRHILSNKVPGRSLGFPVVHNDYSRP